MSIRLLSGVLCRCHVSDTVSISVSVFVSGSVSVSVFVFVFVSVFDSVSVPFSISASVSISVFVFCIIYLYISISVLMLGTVEYNASRKMYKATYLKLKKLSQLLFLSWATDLVYRQLGSRQVYTFISDDEVSS